MIELIIALTVLALCFLYHILWSAKMWKETILFMRKSRTLHEQHKKEIDKLKATIKKDREAIADYLNELTIKKKDNE